jgi:acetyl esterase
VLHPQARAALAEWAQQPSIGGAGPEEIARRRREHRTAAGADPREPVAQARDVDAGGVPCRLYLPESRGELPGAIVFLHGGGFVFGELDTHDPQSRRLANRTGMAVLAVDYRRPPEHRFPAAPDDVDVALSWLRDQADGLGLDAARVVALGDSAGGKLALEGALRSPKAIVAAVLD